MLNACLAHKNDWPLSEIRIKHQILMHMCRSGTALIFQNFNIHEIRSMPESPVYPSTFRVEN